MRLVVRYMAVSALSLVIGFMVATIGLIRSEELQMAFGEKQMIHELEEPFLIATSDAEKPYYMLPAGAKLFFHSSMPEGFDTYIIYVNYKGQLPLKEAEKPNLISPIWAYRVEKENVLKLLERYPVSKDDLVRILKARKMTRDDLAEIVRNWKE